MTAALLFCIINFLSCFASAEALGPGEKKKAAAQTHSFSCKRSKRADRYTLPFANQPGRSRVSLFSGAKQGEGFHLPHLQNADRIICLYFTFFCR